MEDSQATTTMLLENLLLIKRFTKKSLALRLGISRPTLDSRLQGKSKWKTLEIGAVEAIYKKSIE